MSEQEMMNEQTTGPQAPPTSDERSMAMLAHILMLFTGFLGPLILYLVKRESRFVSFHALQALLWQILATIVSWIVMGLFLVFMFTWLPHARSEGGPPLAFLGLFPVVFLCIGTLAVATLVLGIVYAVKANNGEWALYPIVGKWAHRLLLRRAPPGP